MTHYVALYEGDSVSYVGDALDGIEPAQGKIMAFASSNAAHVMWSTGARRGQIDMVSTFDLMPSASVAAMASPALSVTGVKRVYAAEGAEGVINSLAAAKQLDNWPAIAKDALEFVTARIKADASMELPWEQLDADQVDKVATLAASVLLRDAFSEA